jgi:hypothetical protein
MESVTVHNLKKLCKLKRLKYSGTKKQLINRLQEYHNIIRLQRLIRKFLGTKNFNGSLICPIESTSIQFPCYGYKPKGQTIFIYYNLGSLINYLLTSGNFRDPITRQEYSETELYKLDTLKKDNKIQGRSIVVSYRNKSFYKMKKEREDDILITERCLDDIFSSMRKIVEEPERRIITQDENIDVSNISKSLLFMSFRVYFQRYVRLTSPSQSNALINRTIDTINESVSRMYKVIVPSEVSMMRDTIIQFLYQVQYDEINI